MWRLGALLFVYGSLAMGTVLYLIQECGDGYYIFFVGLGLGLAAIGAAFETEDYLDEHF